jgi:predicted aldo/keto reductase-like oxidoreductase
MARRSFLRRRQSVVADGPYHVPYHGLLIIIFLSMEGNNMAEKAKKLSRRQFVKAAGAAGIGATLMGQKALAQNTQGSPRPAAAKADDMPLRTFGKTGEKVSILALGGIHDYRTSQILLDQALKMGVTYWDTAEDYYHGGSEEGMGQYFAKYPESREKVFLVSKTHVQDPEGLTKALEGSTERLKTSYVDMYFLHGVTDPEKTLTPEVKQWAEKVKAEGRIRYFGFSTHMNVEGCLEAASRLGWIDGMMMTYNFRTMGTDRMKAAIEAAAKAGIGLTAMKTQALMPTGPMPKNITKPRHLLTEEEEREMRKGLAEMNQRALEASPDELTLEMTERFRNKGFSTEQAKLQLIWENPQIASICSAMYNMAVLTQNVDAAIGRVRLTQKDKDLLAFYAIRTSGLYCPGCTRHCQVGLDENMPIGDVMRCLMYARNYGDRDLGKTTYQTLPSKMREAIPRWDYAAAEKRCPNGLPVGRLMREAAVELA